MTPSAKLAEWPINVWSWAVAMALQQPGAKTSTHHTLLPVLCSETSAPDCSTCPTPQLDSCVCHVPELDKSWGNQFEPLKAVILRELTYFGTLQFCTCEVVINIFFTISNHLCSWISQLKAYNAFQKNKKKQPKPGSSGSSIKPDFQSYIF